MNDIVTNKVSMNSEQGQEIERRIEEGVRIFPEKVIPSVVTFEPNGEQLLGLTFVEPCETHDDHYWTIFIPLHIAVHLLADILQNATQSLGKGGKYGH